MSAEEFDLLDTGSKAAGSKQRTTDPSKIMDQMKSRLETENDPQMRQTILNATLDQVMDMAEEDKKDLLSSIRDMTDYQHEVGLKFEGFNTLNNEEQRIISRAEDALKKAKAELEAAEKAPDSLLFAFTGFFNKKWSREGRIDTAQARVKEMQEERTQAEHTAKQLFNKRIEKADMEQLLTQYSNKSRATCDLLKEREQEITATEADLMEAMVEANRVHTMALQKQAEAEEKQKTATAAMITAQNVLREITDKSSTEYAKQLKVVTDLERDVENQKGLVASYMSLAASKDSFTNKHSLALNVLTTIRNNLATHRVKLASDTQERVKFYDAYVVSIKAKTDQEFAAILEQLGVRTDKMLSVTLAATHSASQKARVDMMNAIPKHEREMAEVYATYAEAVARFRKEDDAIKESFEDKYGIQVEKQFEQYYAAKKGENSQPEESGDVSPKREKPGDDLLGGSWTFPIGHGPPGNSGGLFSNLKKKNMKQLPIPTEFDSMILGSKDNYAEYFGIINHALRQFLSHNDELLAEDVLNESELRILQQHCHLFLNTLGAMRLRYLHDPDRDLRVDTTLSGYPNFNEMRYIVNDLEISEEKIDKLPADEEVKQMMLDYLLKKKQHVPAGLLHKASLLRYYKSIDPDRLFHRFNQGKVVSVGEDYLVSWSFYDIATNRPYVCFLNFEYSGEDISKDIQTLYTSIKNHGYRWMPLQVMGYSIDTDCPYIHPQKLRCVDLGPVYSVFAQDEDTLTQALRELIASRHLPPNSSTLQVRIDVLQASGEKIVKNGTFFKKTEQRIQQYAVTNSEYGSTFHHEYLFAPHGVIQHLMPKVREQLLAFTKVVIIPTFEEMNYK